MGSAKASSACSESGPGTGSGSKQVKSCSDCYATKTPLWRGGPAGPKTLCNACGIKYNKKRRQKMAVAKKDKGKSKKNAAAHGGGSGGNGELKESLKRKLVELGVEILLKGKRSGKVLSSLREEEQAAMLLMALSCESVNAYNAAAIFRSRV